MNKKKRIVPLLVAALTMASALPVMADETADTVPTQEISDAKQAGSTTVTANVGAIDPGDVTYVVSVPSYIDFGSLSRDEEATGNANNVTKSGKVTLTQVEGLKKDQRIAVLMQDAANGTNGFRISAISGAALNKGQTLNYTVMCGEQELNSTNSTPYTNGFLVGAFQSVNDTVNVNFVLDQNQMTGVLDDWAGTYQGTVIFYSRVAGASDYN